MGSGGMQRFPRSTCLGRNGPSRGPGGLWVREWLSPSNRVVAVPRACLGGRLQSRTGR